MALVRVTALTLAALSMLGGVAQADVHVPRGEVLREIHVVGSDVRLDGTVTGQAVVVGGDLVLGATGRVHSADLLVGNLRAAPGAHVSGRVLQVGGALPRPRGPRAWIFIAVALALRSLLGWLILQAALLAAPRRLLAELTEATGEAPLRTLIGGGLGGVGLVSAAVLTSVSVIGLPVAAALVGLLLSGSVAGMAIALRSAGPGRPGRLMLVALLVPVLGEALGSLATVVGLGGLMRVLGSPSLVAGNQVTP